MSKEVLQNYYKSFIDEKNKQNFWLGFIDYVNFILTDKKCEQIISDIETSKEEIIEEKNKSEALANENVQKIKNEFEAGKKELAEVGIKIPQKSNEESDGNTDRMLYPDEYDEVSKIEVKLKEGQKKELWGSWDVVYDAYTKIKSQNEFEIEKYKPHLTRLHNNLMRKLAGEKNEKPNELSFDLSKGILNIGGEKVKISISSNQYQLLAIIFEDRNELFREWFFSEIRERMDMTGSLKDDKKIHNLANYFNSKIARKTGIKKFFKTTLHSLRINPDYNFS